MRPQCLRARWPDSASLDFCAGRIEWATLAARPLTRGHAPRLERISRERNHQPGRVHRPHDGDGPRGEGQAPEALHALRHLLLPHLHHRRRGHARRRRGRGGPGLHVAHLPRGRVLRPVRVDRCGARLGVPGGGWLVRLDAACVGAARGGRQRRLLLVQQPDLDRGHARAPDDRDRRPVLLLDR